MPLESFARQTASKDGRFHRCRTCWTAYNDRINGISRIAYSLVGGDRAFYALPKDVRIATRDHARRLYEAGTDYVTATQRTDVADGFVYIVSHPAWPDFLKIGCAINPDSRLRDYQTYCPQRSFQLEHAVYCSDRRQAEAQVHARFASVRAAGEWFQVSLEEALDALNAVASPFHYFQE